MPIRQFITGKPETATDFLLAADDRDADAEELVIQQRFDGAVYLFVYAVEMWLKVACLRLRGLGPAVQVKAALPPLKAWMKTYPSAMAAPADGHDLAYYADCIDALRGNAQRPLPLNLSAGLRAHVSNGMHPEWKVDMRYRHSGLTAADAWAALANASWVRTNWLSLT